MAKLAEIRLVRGMGFPGPDSPSLNLPLGPKSACNEEEQRHLLKISESWERVYADTP